MNLYLERNLKKFIKLVIKDPNKLFIDDYENLKKLELLPVDMCHIILLATSILL